ncbi:Plasminogen [Toxocara canis]|uniref:Plasminogen n=1 Tax=Toxocara canis TaxID=6265 RepID=A0A0B2V8X7_TOXCA|nr:Plasminogen [Toxocara canis]
MGFSDVVVLALTLLCAEKEALAFIRRVAYGTVIDPEKYPYVVEVIVENETTGYQCTGSLISRSVVLTAGHCVSGKEMEYSVQFRKRGVLTTIIHKTVSADGGLFAVFDYNHPINIKSANIKDFALVDVGLIVLNEPLPICEREDGRLYSVLPLPISNRYSDEWTSYTNSFEDCKLLGYGVHELGIPDGQLRELNVSVQVYANALVSVLRGKGAACPADSGGPVICLSREKEYIAAGIISHGRGKSRELKPQCYGNKWSPEGDVFVDIRIALPIIKEGLIRLGKLKEFLADNMSC